MSLATLRLVRESMHEAYGTLQILVGATAAKTLMLGYVDSASKDAISAAQAQDSTSSPEPTMMHASTQTSPPPPPKKPRKKSIAKKLERLNGAIERLHVQAAASAEPSTKESSEANEEDPPKNSAAHQAVDVLDAAAADITAHNPSPAHTLSDTPSAGKRSPRSSDLSPAATPSRTHAGKKQRAHHAVTQSPRHQWTRTLVPNAPLANPPPPVALLAQTFARRAIHGSEWYWLAEPGFEHTFSQCVHLISVELLKHNSDHWPRICSMNGPPIVREQMELDGVAIISE